jgi:hypothetical protein
MSMNDLVYDNRTLLAKADLSLADLTADGGLLKPRQAKKFIHLLIKESVLLKMGTVRPMDSPKHLIEQIGFGQRILRAGTEATPLDPADRAKPDLSSVELDAKLFKAEVRLSNETLEDSIERSALRQTIMQMMGERIATDMDEIIAKGDTSSPDTFLSRLDGILKQSTSHVVDAASAPTSKSLFRDMLKSMPSQYLRNRKKLRYFTSVDAEIDYRDTLAERATVVGDKFLEQDAPVLYGGIPILDVPMFPENLGAGGNATNILLTDPKNINIGIWRRIRIETDKNISAGVLIIVATLRFDVKYEEETAAVKAINVTSD